ncbi:MAG: twin-arginine translocation signal domain-containing protein, partial [Bacteroidales bacterium]
MTNRRDFLRRSALVAAAIPLLKTDMLGTGRPAKKTGLALYTIRDLMGKDPS